MLHTTDSSSSVFVMEMKLPPYAQFGISDWLDNL